MREIKFRAWDKKHNEMRYLGVGDSFRFWSDGNWTIVNTVYLPGTLVTDHEKAILMQYTGLKDKSGKEIYEGDIFQFGTKKEGESGEGERGIVEWHEQLARFGLSFYSIYGGEGYTGKTQHLVECIKGKKVIGNIHENPELLESHK